MKSFKDTLISGLLFTIVSACGAVEDADGPNGSGDPVRRPDAAVINPEPDASFVVLPDATVFADATALADAGTTGGLPDAATASRPDGAVRDAGNVSIPPCDSLVPVFENEPNNTRADAQDLVSCVLVRGGALTSGWDSDFYRVIPPDGATSIRIALTDMSPGDSTDMYVLLEDDEEQILERLNARPREEVEIVTGVTAGAAYFIRVWSRNTREYELAVSLGARNYETERNNTEAQAQEILSGVQYFGRSSLDSWDNDYFALAVPDEDTSLTVELVDLSPGDSSDIEVRILDGNSAVLEYRRASAGDSVKITTGVRPETYFLWIRGRSGRRYSVTATLGRETWETETNDVPAEGQKMEPGTTYFGQDSKISGWDNDYFIIVVGPMSSSIKVELEDRSPGASSDVEVRLLNPSEELLDYRLAEPGGTVATTTGVVEGEYIVWVRGRSDRQYAITASLGTEDYEVEINDTASQAQIIDSGVIYSGQDNQGDSGYDNDFFQLEVSTSFSSVDIVLSDTALGNSSDVELRLLNEDEELLEYLLAKAGDSVGFTTGVREATYYLWVRGRSSRSYEVEATLGADAYEIELNNTRINAQPVLSGVVYRGRDSNVSGNDNDYFTFELSTDGDVTVKLTDVSSGTRTFTRVSLIDDSTTLDGVNALAGDTVSINRTLAPGTYYVLVNLDGDREYDLEVNF